MHDPSPTSNQLKFWTFWLIWCAATSGHTAKFWSYSTTVSSASQMAPSPTHPPLPANVKVLLVCAGPPAVGAAVVVRVVVTDRGGATETRALVLVASCVHEDVSRSQLNNADPVAVDILHFRHPCARTAPGATAVKGSEVVRSQVD